MLQGNANLTVDEAVYPFRGRVSFRAYMKNKPNKHGIKLFELCDSAIGYILNATTYAGSDGSVVFI